MEVTAWQLDHAFFMMNMHSVFAATSSAHQIVGVTLERMGFKPVGIMRECAYKWGKYVDSVMYGILKDEWSVVRGE